MRMLVNFSDDQVEELILKAISLGYKKKEPEKPWTRVERQEAIQYAITRMAVNDD